MSSIKYENKLENVTLKREEKQNRRSLGELANYILKEKNDYKCQGIQINRWIKLVKEIKKL